MLRPAQALSSVIFAPARGREAAAVEQVAIDGPVGIYLHVPFCGARCRYCSFNTVPLGGQLERYEAAVRREIDGWAAHPGVGRVEASSVYVGGGTPTAVPAAVIERLLGHLRRRFAVPAGTQITLEANPESLTADKLARYRAAGVDRISLGAQSFDPRQLRLLGRRHGPRRIHRALRLAHEAGVPEVSLDLMYALPGQDLAAFDRDLRQAIAAPAGHLSLFSMVYRRGSNLRRRRPGWRAAARMYRHALEVLRLAGYRQYTTEDFTRSGVRCEYQLDVWQPPARGCLGLGPGARTLLPSYSWYNAGRLEAYAGRLAAGTLAVADCVRLGAVQRATDHLLGAVKCLGRRRGQRGPGLVGLPPDVTFLASVMWGEFILERLDEAARSS